MAVQRNDSWPIFWFNSLFLHTIKGNVGQFYFLWNNSCWNHLNFFSLFYLVTITKRYSGALNLWRKKPSLSTKCECILNVINDLSILSLLENSIRSIRELSVWRRAFTTLHWFENSLLESETLNDVNSHKNRMCRSKFNCKTLLNWIL